MRQMMKTFNQFINEDLQKQKFRTNSEGNVFPVKYNQPDYQKLSDNEHGETTHQSSEIKSGNMETPHPAIEKAIHKFASNKPAFKKALENSSIEKVKKGTEVNNSEIGQGIKSVEDKQKVKRVSEMIKNNQPIDRPIILRHKDKDGNVYHHLLAGNTRATIVGYGVEAHHIDV
jgi:hypothetical protein